MYTRVPYGEHLQTSLTLTRALRDEVVDPGTSRRHAPAYVTTHPATLFPFAAALCYSSDSSVYRRISARQSVRRVLERGYSGSLRGHARRRVKFTYVLRLLSGILRLVLLFASPRRARLGQKSPRCPRGLRTRREWSFATSDTLGWLSMG